MKYSNTNTYTLERREVTNQPQRKFICPECGKKSFVRYINRFTFDYLADECGMCDHVHSCGFHYPPKQFFAEHKEVKRQFTPREQAKQFTQARATPVRPLPIFPDNFLQRISTPEYYPQNNLFRALSAIFGADAVKSTFERYKVGTAKEWRYKEGYTTVFPQIDNAGRVRQLKYILYNPDNGKRLHSGDTGADRYNTRTQRYYPDTESDKAQFRGGLLYEQTTGQKRDSVEFRQTLFGAHLIPGANKIGIVESEKTALICSILMPGVTWLATSGGHNGRLEHSETCEMLRGHNVTLYPDSGMFAEWKSKYESALRRHGVTVSTSKLCEGSEFNTDIADYLLQAYKAKQSHSKQEKTQETRPIESEQSKMSEQRSVFSDNKELNEVLKLPFIDKRMFPLESYIGVPF